MSSLDEQSRQALHESTPDWLRELSPEYRYRVHVCFGKNCTPNGAESVFNAFQDEIRARRLTSEVELIATSCRSRCELGPSVNVYPGPVMYGRMDPDGARIVTEMHLAGAKIPVAAYVVSEEEAAEAKRKAGR